MRTLSAVLGSTDPNACTATLTGAYNDLYERVGAVPIVIIVILAAAWVRSKLK